jgi:hypothetical protein
MRKVAVDSVDTALRVVASTEKLKAIDSGSAKFRVAPSTIRRCRSKSMDVTD